MREPKKPNLTDIVDLEKSKGCIVFLNKSKKLPICQVSLSREAVVKDLYGSPISTNKNDYETLFGIKCNDSDESYCLLQELKLKFYRYRHDPDWLYFEPEILYYFYTNSKSFSMDAMTHHNESK